MITPASHTRPPPPVCPPPQALLANIASLYAVYHGPKGLQTIAQRVNGMASVLAAGAQKLGHGVPNKPFFDTVAITVGDAKKVRTCGSAADMGCVCGGGAKGRRGPGGQGCAVKGVPGGWDAANLPRHGCHYFG